VRLSPPQSIQIGSANATREEDVLGIISKGVPALKVAKPTEVALEGGE
jgi:hypothetical protein